MKNPLSAITILKASQITNWEKSAVKKYAAEKKWYPRFQRVTLPADRTESPLERLLVRRSSARTYSEKVPTFFQIASLLRIAVAQRKGHRAAPSAGALYPIEVYAIVRGNIRELDRGTYHVDAHRPALELIDPIPVTNKQITGIFNHAWIMKAPIILICTAVVHRTEQKYGSRALRYILLESGHIMQNILLMATQLGMKSCPLGAFTDNPLAKLLHIEKTDEYPVYAVTIGR